MGAAGSGRAGAAALAWAAVLVALLALCAAGCSGGAQASADSPRPLSASIASSGDGSEAAQRVEVRMSFDAPLEARGDVAGDLAVTVDGEPPDLQTTEIAARVESDTLVVSLSPSESARDGLGSTRYFACYGGALRIASARGDGALGHALSPAGDAAVLDAPFEFTVPSGVKLGGERARASKTSVEVVSAPCLRCCTWLEVDGRDVCIHNHDFARSTPQLCASQLAEAVNRELGDSYAAEASGAVLHVSSKGGPAPELKIREGLR